MELDFEFIGKAVAILDRNPEIQDFDESGATPDVGDLVALTLRPAQERVVFQCVSRLWDLSQAGAPVLRVTLDLPE